MSDSSVYPDGPDQDTEATMTAPAEGRPDGSVQAPDSIGHDGPHAQDADDQSGSEDPDA